MLPKEPWDTTIYYYYYDAGQYKQLYHCRRVDIHALPRHRVR